MHILSFVALNHLVGDLWEDDWRETFVSFLALLLAEDIVEPHKLDDVADALSNSKSVTIESSHFTEVFMTHSDDYDWNWDVLHANLGNFFNGFVHIMNLAVSQDQQHMVVFFILALFDMFARLSNQGRKTSRSTQFHAMKNTLISSDELVNASDRGVSLITVNREAITDFRCIHMGGNSAKAIERILLIWVVLMEDLHHSFQRVEVVISLDLINVVEWLRTFDRAIWIGEVNSADQADLVPRVQIVRELVHWFHHTMDLKWRTTVFSFWFLHWDSLALEHLVKLLQRSFQATHLWVLHHELIASDKFEFNLLIRVCITQTAISHLNRFEHMICVLRKPLWLINLCLIVINSTEYLHEVGWVEIHTNHRPRKRKTNRLHIEYNIVLSFTFFGYTKHDLTRLLVLLMLKHQIYFLILRHHEFG